MNNQNSLQKEQSVIIKLPAFQHYSIDVKEVTGANKTENKGKNYEQLICNIGIKICIGIRTITLINSTGEIENLILNKLIYT